MLICNGKPLHDCFSVQIVYCSFNIHSAIQESLQDVQSGTSMATGVQEPEPREESDLELALRLSQQVKEEEDRRKREEEDILQKVLQLSMEDK